MFKHYLEKCRCGSNHNFHNKRTHLINSNDSDLGTEVVRTVYYIRLDILHRNKRSTNLVKYNRKDEIQTIQRIHRFAIHNKRPNMIKYWDNKCNTGHNHTHNIASVHMHIEYGIRRAEIRKTQPEKQILVGISILPNLCRDIDFGKVSRKRPELRQHHEHGDTTLRRYTTNWIMRNKMPKTLQDSQKWLEISILPDLCKDIDFGKVSRKRPELCQPHHEHSDATLRG